MLSEDRKLLLAIANNLSLVKFLNIADHRTSDWTSWAWLTLLIIPQKLGKTQILLLIWFALALKDFSWHIDKNRVVLILTIRLQDLLYINYEFGTQKFYVKSITDLDGSIFCSSDIVSTAW